MQITVVVSICHALAGITSPVCHEEILVRDEMPMQACMIAQAAIADWKAHSRFSGNQWTVSRIRCIPGDYQPRDAI